MKILYGRSALVRGALAGAIAVGLGVSGCSKNIEPEAGKTASPTTSKSAGPTPSETPTPTPTRTPTPTPTAPTGSVEEQLHAATVNFYAAVTHAYERMDPAPIKAVVVPGTTAGGGYIDRIAKLKSQGHRFDPAPTYKITKFRYMRDGSDRISEVRFRLDSPPFKEVDSQGRTVRSIPAGGDTARIFLTRRGNRWLVLSQHFDSN